VLATETEQPKSGTISSEVMDVIAKNNRRTIANNEQIEAIRSLVRQQEAQVKELTE
jgi:hypothetical protein